MTVDQRFGLLADDGRVAYPYRKTQRATKRFGFALTRPGEGDRHGGGEYVPDLETVVRRVVLDGWSVRARGVDGRGPRGDSIGLGKRSFNRYWLSPELRHLVEGAPPSVAGLPEPLTDEERALAAMDRLTADGFESALRELESSITQEQREMLVGHAQAGGCTASMQQIASFAGYPSFVTANAQYGRLGGIVAEKLGVAGLRNKTQALATASGEAGEEGHWQWTMRPGLVEALVRLGWAEPQAAPSLAACAAEAEVAADPRCAGVSETMRKALVNARLGQGGYRRRMLRLWGGRCALTGCGVEAVLIASHAKRWEDSSNEERLDEHNGLLLAASIDKLFDRGLISFADDGALLVSSSLGDKDLESLGISRASRIPALPGGCIAYLKEHRRQSGFPV